MTTDNRANEPTEAQVEAAWQSLLETAIDVTTRADVRAALEAAAGAAPQVPSEDRAMEIAQALARAHMFTSVDALSIANAALALAAPVLPSSTVGEGLTVRLAEMLYDDQTGTRGKFETSAFRDAWVKRVRAVVEATGGEER